MHLQLPKLVQKRSNDEEISGATYADGLGTAVAGVFGGLPNTSFSQNVGIVGMTGIMSRHVVTIAGIIMIICGLIPRLSNSCVNASTSIRRWCYRNVWYGGIWGMNVLGEIKMTRRNMVIIALSSVGLGLNLVPSAVQYLPGIVKVLATSAVVTACSCRIEFNFTR